MAQPQYTLIKLPVREIIMQNYNVCLTKDEEMKNEYLVAQGDSLLFNQIERLRGHKADHMEEMILVVAKKNPKQEKELRKLLESGFTYNGVHYSRFGKSASQGKAGITAFISDDIFDELYRITQMDIAVNECVISKYEAQRCLTLSSCTVIPGFMPNIVIIDEYQKLLPGQYIKYVVEREREYVDQESGEVRKYHSREIEEGYKDIPLSPFDGCGCHEEEFMAQASKALGLDYHAVGAQIRLPFMKGYSVYVPFRRILKSWGYSSITDIYGHVHDIDGVDCIWNISMFKGHKLFFNKYGKDAWTGYMRTLHKYEYKLGISKYSHHIKNLNRKTRMNFQYLQCLDLWNPRYIQAFEDKKAGTYDILSENNQGRIITIAQYTTNLFEKIIKGDKFYTYKFLGITDTSDDEPDSSYLKAALINDTMLKDPAVRKFIYRKLKKAITEAKAGKIYADGFYHTIVGDMIGYLQYAAGEEPAGCLNAGEFYCGTMSRGDCLSFRSPLVCPSEVNKVRIVDNEITRQWFSHFEDQDVVMLNMHDLSLPQQGGADCDGDIFLLCNDPIIINAKIEKPIIIDIEDKTTAVAKPYTKQNIIDYEVMTRDNRIGEITNTTTSIENKYTTNPDIKKMYSDLTSLLRVYQGKEIDFLKTGLRWQMNKGLRKYLQQLPYFLLYNYPKKMDAYEKTRTINKNMNNPENKLPLNAYHSPSPMNELCDYICTWEKKHLLWDNSAADTGNLIINNTLDLSDKHIIRTVRHYINDYAVELKHRIDISRKSGSGELNIDLLVDSLKTRLRKELTMNEELIANYVIKVSYNSRSISKSFAWAGYSDYIIENLRNNSDPRSNVSIVETPHRTDTSYEYLGKYYEFKVTAQP